MNREQLDAIFEDTNSKWTGDNFVQGIKILEKYFDSTKEIIIEGSIYDKVWAPHVEELLERNFSEEDAITLRKLNWFIDKDSECFACYV